MDRLATLGIWMLQELPCQLSVYAISRLLPHHSCFATPSQQTRLFYWVLPYFSSHFDPSPPLPSPTPNCFPSPCLSMMQEKRERELWKHSTHTSIQKKQNSPHSATSKVIDVLHLRAKVAAAISWDQLHICKQASKQGGGTERYLIFWSLLLTTQIGFHLLICNVSFFVCFFFPGGWDKRIFLLMGEMGFLGLVHARQHSWNSILLLGIHWLVWKKKEGKREDSFEGFFAFSSVT